MREDHEPQGPVTQGSSLKPLFIGSMLGVGLIVAGLAIPSPYVIEKPGVVVNTLGDIVVDGEEQPVIRFDGEAPHSDATLNLLTVARVGNPDDRLGWLEVLPALFSPRQELVPIAQAYPQGQTAEERDAANLAMMENSHMTATTAALNALGEPIEAEVSVANVVADSPASGAFAEGDIIVEVGGNPVTGMSMVRNAVLHTAPGEDLEVTVLRDGTSMQISVQPMLNPNTSLPYIGVVMTADYAFPHDITFDVDRIGGPSAGMMFSLAIVEELGDEDLAGNHVVSGTGTIDDGGHVGPIGGLTQKIWAAHDVDTDLFLMPVANCADLPRNLPDDMPIVPVATLAEALTSLDEFREGTLNTGLERCKTELAQVAPVG